MDIVIDPVTGTLRCMFSEDIGEHLRGGIVRAEKVSDVRFDTVAQEWIAVDRGTGATVARHATRAGCVALEHAYYDGQISSGDFPWRD